MMAATTTATTELAVLRSDFCFKLSLLLLLSLLLGFENTLKRKRKKKKQQHQQQTAFSSAFRLEWQKRLLVRLLLEGDFCCE